MIDIGEIAQTVRTFIANPADREAFDRFLILALRLARAYIAMRVRRGSLYVPANEFPAASAVDDCACECLGSLFESRPGRPFYLITEYFGPRIDSATPPDRIYALLQGVIAGHLDQELMRFNPQSVAIRRAILRAMSEPEFEKVRAGGHDHWALRSTANARREHLPQIEDDALQHVINGACRRFSDMPDRCRFTFEALNQDDRFQNLIECRRFIAILIRILTDHDGSAPSQGPDPNTDYIRRTVRILADNAMRSISEDLLPSLVKKRGLNDIECLALRHALTNLMTDFAEDGSHDLLPGYLKEVMPAGSEKVYLQRYKYAWETLVANAKERLRAGLREEGLAP